MFRILGVVTSTLEKGIFEQNLTITKNKLITTLVNIEKTIPNINEKIIDIICILIFII